ncbi:MAG: LysM peptidoglycan-binding domain-containing protein [Bacteriovoracaceae bacterium]
MAFITRLLMILSLLFMVACSSNSSDSSKDQTAGVEEDADFLVDSEDELLDDEEDDIELADSDDFDDDEYEDDEDFEDDELEDDEEIEVASEEDVMDKAPIVAGNEFEMSGEYGKYKVQRGDTFMLIAFKLYGDYTKWRQIANMNPGYGSGLPVGTVLKYNKPSSRFEWNPEGLPHLIQRGETLGTISSDKYGTNRRWKDIWNNNRPMIKDPNLIFAGFTVYYIPDERDVASGQ